MKTFFFALSAPTVFKNFFFFEDSMYDQLQRHLAAHPDVRCICVLTHAGVIFDYFFRERPPHERFVREYVPFGKDRSFLQRLFRFFYAYFIYTGTTAVMATIGIRPDEPPAGGRLKRYLGPVKRLISLTFGRSRFWRERAVPFLYYRVFPERPFARLFEKYGPDMVFVPHLYGPFDAALLAEAKRRGVPTIGMISNWDHFDKYFLPFKADRILCQSDQIKRFAIKHQGYDPARIQLVGYPYFDFIFHNRDAASRRDLLSELRLPAGSRYLLYVSGSAYCRDEPEIVEEILRWVEQGAFGPDMHLVIRPYAGTRRADRDYDRVKFDRFLGHPRARVFAGESWGNVEKSVRFVSVVRHSDAVLVVYSTAALEAAALDRPVIAPTFDGWHTRPFRESIRRFEIREHFRDVMRSGAVRPAYDFGELREAIESALRDPGRDRAERAKLIENLCYRVDGKSSERVLRLLLDAIG